MDIISGIRGIRILGNNYNFGWGYHYPHNHWAFHNHWSHWHGHYLGYYPTYFILMTIIACILWCSNNNNRTPEAFANRYVQEVKERP